MVNWVNRDSKTEAIERAQALGRHLAAQGLRIIRVKVEHELVHVSLDTSLQPNEYFEFHIKIPVKHSSEYDRLQALGRPHGVIWSTLVQSKTVEFVPISTLRIKTGTVGEALARKAQWVDTLNQHDIHLHAKMHQELCIYDDCVELDEGWEGPGCGGK